MVRISLPIEDLPGTYSLDPISPDEEIVATVLEEADTLAGLLVPPDGGERLVEVRPVLLETSPRANALARAEPPHRGQVCCYAPHYVSRSRL